MNGSSTAERLADNLVPGPQTYLGSHRALAACNRELARLFEEIARQVRALPAALDEKPVIRQSPDRLIVQLGPVALTVAWLRSTLDSVAEGEMLAIVWHGSVAPRGGERRPERMTIGDVATRPAAMLWEETLTADAVSEAGWRWRAQRADAAEESSVGLAALWVERLRDAHDLHNNVA